MMNMHWMNLDIEQTLSMSRKALEINPYDAATIFSNAVAKAQNGDFDSALSSLESTFEIDLVSKRDQTVTWTMMDIGADQLKTALMVVNNALDDNTSGTHYIGFKAVILGLFGHKD